MTDKFLCSSKLNSFIRQNICERDKLNLLLILKCLSPFGIFFMASNNPTYWNNNNNSINNSSSNHQAVSNKCTRPTQILVRNLHNLNIYFRIAALTNTHTQTPTHAQRVANVSSSCGFFFLDFNSSILNDRVKDMRYFNGPCSSIKSMPDFD